ncbi:MAG: response regulator [Chloroflexi bacterium]|nr:response regulator [Chloroflexota bacterium]
MTDITCSAAPGPQPTILVVDDEPGVRHLICRALQLAGFQTQQAADGSEALQYIQRMAATRQWVRAVVLDLALPQLDGLAVLRYLRSRNPDLPVIAISADIDRLQEASAAGADRILAKPFRVTDLLAAVARWHDTPPDVVGFSADLLLAVVP